MRQAYVLYFFFSGCGAALASWLLGVFAPPNKNGCQGGGCPNDLTAREGASSTRRTQCPQFHATW